MALTTATNSTLFGSPFLENAGLAFWVDNYNMDLDTGDGMTANQADCSNKKKFASNVDYWFLKGDNQIVYSDDVANDAATSTIKFATISNGIFSFAL